MFHINKENNNKTQQYKNKHGVRKTSKGGEMYSLKINSVAKIHKINLTTKIHKINFTKINLTTKIHKINFTTKIQS